jgi:hypothetical protein
VSALTFSYTKYPQQFLVKLHWMEERAAQQQGVISQGESSGSADI